MTPEEAQIIASIIATADHSCISCVSALAQALTLALPEPAEV